MTTSRDRTGRFTVSDSTIQSRAAAQRMKACLERDTKAAEHARGVVWEHGHYHALPNPDRLSVVAMPSVEPTLFDVLEAA